MKISLDAIPSDCGWICDCCEHVRDNDRYHEIILKKKEKWNV